MHNTLSIKQLSLITAFLLVLLFLFNSIVPEQSVETNQVIIEEAPIDNARSVFIYKNESLLARDTIFIKSVFHIAKLKLFRIVTIQRCHLPKKYARTMAVINFEEMSIDFNTSIKSTQACPWFFNPKCIYMAHIIDVKYGSKAESLQLLFQQPNPLRPTDIGLTLTTNGRTLKLPQLTTDIVMASTTNYKQTKEHLLAVCVQPLYFYAEWIQMVQFFELWLLNGCTHFFIYVHSMTREVRQLLQIYIDDHLVTLVDWTRLPYQSVDEMTYRVGVDAAINDCNMRAAAQAEFVAHVDLDEVIYSMKMKTIAQFIEMAANKQPNIGAFIFRSANARINVPKYLEPDGIDNIIYFQSINFTYLNKITLDSNVFPRGTRSKLITRPSLVKSIQVHDVLEVNMESVDTKVVGTEHALVLHLRRIPSAVAPEFKGTKEISLTDWAGRATQNFQARLKRQHTGAYLPYRGLSIMKEFETCVNALFNRRLKECTSVIKCRNTFTLISPFEWDLPIDQLSSFWLEL